MEMYSETGGQIGETQLIGEAPRAA